MNRWILAGLGAALAIPVFLGIKVAVPKTVNVDHRFSGYPTITLKVQISGLESLQPVPKRIVLQLPEGFTLRLPTDFSGTVDGEIEVEQK